MRTIHAVTAFALLGAAALTSACTMNAGGAEETERASATSSALGCIGCDDGESTPGGGVGGFEGSPSGGGGAGDGKNGVDEVVVVKRRPSPTDPEKPKDKPTRENPGPGGGGGKEREPVCGDGKKALGPDGSSGSDGSGAPGEGQCPDPGGMRQDCMRKVSLDYDAWMKYCDETYSGANWWRCNAGGVGSKAYRINFCNARWVS